YYACVNQREGHHLYLGYLFADRLVHFEYPKNTLSHVCSEFCPAVTLECSLSGDSTALDACYQFLKTVIHLEEIPELPSDAKFDYYEMKAKMKMPENIDFSVGYDRPHSPIQIAPDLDLHNF